MTLPIAGLIRATFRDPRGTLRMLIARDIPTGTLWQALVLMAILIVLIEQGLLILGGGVGPIPGDLEADPVAMLVWSAQAMFYHNPLMVAGLQALFCVVAALALYRVGRMFGGQGDLREALTTMDWFLVIYFCLTLITIIASLLVPFLAGFVALGVFVANAWLATEFTRELHGFSNPLLVFIGIVATAILITLLIAIVASIFLSGLIGGVNGL